MDRKIGLIIALAGLALLILPVKIPGLAIITCEDWEQCDESVPAPADDKSGPSIVFVYPQAGWTYESVSQIGVSVGDASGVAKVSAKPSWANAVELSVGAGTAGAAGPVWSASVAPLNVEGAHSVTVTAVDNVGNTAQATTSFTIKKPTAAVAPQSVLKGRWFVNDIEVTPKLAKILTTSISLKFTFIKAPDSQTADANIRASVLCNAKDTPDCSKAFESTPLPSVGPGKWEITKVVSNGRYSFTLNADSAGSGSVTYGVIVETGVPDARVNQAQGGLQLPELGIRSVLAVGMIAGGLFIYRRGGSR